MLLVWYQVSGTLIVSSPEMELMCTGWALHQDRKWFQDPVPVVILTSATEKAVILCSNDKCLRYWQYTVVGKRVRYFVLLHNSYKYWSIIKTRDSFEIYVFWGFQNCPWKLNLTNIWLKKKEVQDNRSISKKCLRLDFVFVLDFLSQIWVKSNFQGQFWNPQDVQIPKLSLVLIIDQEL